MPSFLRRGLVASLALTALAAPAAARADDLPTTPDWYVAAGAEWTQEYATSPDGTKVHLDILKPKGVDPSKKLPVILSAGPYFNHSGQEGPVGATADDYQPGGTAGPSRRFQDLVVGGHLMQKGYAFVMADLRGFGGSTGCLDWGGAGEQSDVKAAVEYLAGRPWSTGRVGMYGKSYDGVTGLVGIAQQPKGLAAVISQEPVFDLYRYLYSNGMKFENSLATPALYDAIAATPGVVGPQGDGTDYLASTLPDATNPACLATNYASQALNDDHGSAYWKARDLIAATKGKTTPLLLTQGFLENNTKPDGAWDLYNGMAGPKRGWFGMWDHIRGNDLAEGDDRYSPWFDETMAWFDHYVAQTRGDTGGYPANEVQDGDGTWRAEDAWPPTDSRLVASPLKTGSYTDDGSTVGSGDGGALLPTATLSDPGTGGVWTFSPKLTHDAQFSGVPQVHLDLTPSPALPDPGASNAYLTNVGVAVDVYDVDPAGKATILSRTGALIPKTGKLDLGMYGNDWHIPAGHRIGVLVAGSNEEWFNAHVASGADVTINKASIDLPFLTGTRTATIPGKRAARLDEFLAAAPFTVPAAAVTAGESAAFVLPPERTAAGAPTTSEPTATTTEPTAATPTTTQPSTTEPATTPTASTATPASPETTTPGATTTPGTTGTAPGSPAAAGKAALTAHLSVPTGRGTRRVHISGHAKPGSSVVVVLRRNGKAVTRRTVRVTGSGVYRLDIRVRRAGRYTAAVSAPTGTTTSQSVTSRTADVHVRR